ncbi:hypothetical protein HPP_5050 [Hydrangea phyllody phytoplasma]|uniref:Uncharacterized protein n=2 Tax=16SrI (Aster yellows group) TaxID=3042590 RepID=A0ABQ5PSY8_9MOLU|nr:hypothetical protein [Hydrangea phyllody phytoplasma]GFZ75547.1 hypothetical protein HPP_5050 [Hydrangea phyllody phytoplasma]GLH61493.1 hypothetical protein RHYP_4390 [Rhus yellows phytoplasma]GLH62090.1 hypothetical protein HP2P_4970 [Hydrangea phyllody phytoplasma]
MSDGMTEAFRGTYFKSRNSQTKKTNKYNQPKVKWLNLDRPNKTFKNKKKSFKKRRKVIKDY